MTDQKRPLKVFLCHASTDKPKVRELYRYLRRRGIQPWFDEEHLVGGQDWQVEIPKALATSDAIIICLTKNSVDKEGYIQKEIKFALDKALEMPEGRIFLIPVKFEECEVPFTLSRYQWVDLTIESGYAKMMKALKFRASQLERSTVEVSKKNVEEENFAQKEAAEKARLKAEEQKKIKAAKEKEEREAAERVAQEKAEHEAVERLAQEKATRDKAEKEARLETERRAKEKVAEEEERRVKKEEIKKRRLPYYEKPLRDNFSPAQSRLKPQSNKTKLQRKPSTAIAIALIGLAGTIIAALLGLNFIKTQFPSSSIATDVSSPTLSVALSTQSTLPSKTVTPSQTPDASFTSVLDSDNNFNFNLIYLFVQKNKRDLYFLGQDGVTRNLSEGLNFNYIADPVLSPDGKNIAFSTELGIYSLDINSITLERLASFGIKPKWNPNGSEIAIETGDSENYPYSFIDCRYGGCVPVTEFVSKQTIYLIRRTSDGRPIVGIKPWIAYRGVFDVAWNKDGSLYAYVRRNNVDFICVFPQSIGCVQVKDFVESFDWSPSGDRIVFSVSWRGNFDLYLLHLDDSIQINLTNGTYNNYSPVWSHSGEKIAFVSDRDGNNEIYVMDVNSLEFENITKNASDDFSPRWSPDDSKIIFLSDRDNNVDIFSIDLNTREIVNLTNTPEDEFFPIVVGTKP
jgi:hypothetical protein